MKTRLFLHAAIIAAILAFAGIGCSKDKSTNGPPTGGTREFASGDLSTGASFSHTFTTAKVVNYYCRYHGGPGLQGMSGTITVTATGTADQFQVSISGLSLPTMTIPVGSTVRWTNNHVQTHTVESDN